MLILTVNVGSTSVKLRVIGDDDELESSADLPGLSHQAPDELGQTIERLGPVDAVGHRIVHGGARFTRPVRLDDQVVKKLRALADLAPLHQPPALDALEAVNAVLPHVPAVACFDTAFHATLPAEASTYAIPQRWRDLGARRYGFHGLSHAWASKRATQLTAQRSPGAPIARVVTCHLGGGASLAAVAGGRCVDTTMGFTPLDGLVMATRSGSLDPGLVLWLETHVGLAAGDIAADLEHGSGLLGLCGAADVRDVVSRAANPTSDPAAVLALGVYVHRLRAGIAAMAAALDGLDVLVFTGGVGEHSAPVRQAACSRLGFLGVTFDDEANPNATPDQDISRPGTPVRVLVIAAREDLELAHGVRHVLAPHR